MSIPTSFITSIARGLISPDGFVPALNVVYPLGAYFRKKPSAIWLLPAFSTHTNRTVLSLCCTWCFFSLLKDSFIMCRYLLLELLLQQPGIQHGSEFSTSTILSVTFFCFFWSFLLFYSHIIFYN